MSRKYFTLLRREDDKSPWGIEFGAYERDDVAAELECYRDHGDRKKNLRIVQSADRQADIDAVVAELNGKKPS